MWRADSVIEKRLKSLESHLKHENPVLLSAVKGFRELDRVAYRMGLLARTQSFATLIPWWPMIAVLGTFSSGKSTFINYYLGYRLQTTGNQAVDDRFTVVCHSREGGVHVLPGLALDADPRFPFYQIAEEIEKVGEGEGRRVDAYLQLKTCPSERLRGKILIDSPGFDADEQRTSILRITEHIIDLSDLVLVFFDARHPEPGAMHDTLEYLVADTIRRPDSSKFLYILNQIDTTAREDNPEEVFGAWQRALAQKGLTAGRFYTIYNPDAANPIDDESLRRRFEGKRDHDLAEIHDRMERVATERAYRIVGSLESTARDIQDRVVPLLTEAIGRWRRLTLALDGLLFGAILAAIAVVTARAGHWSGLQFTGPGPGFWASPEWTVAAGAGLVVLIGYLHFLVRRFASGRVLKWLTARAENSLDRASLAGAFRRSTRPWRSLLLRAPAGWGRGSRRRLGRVMAETDRFVQTLNDRFTDPSGVRRSPSADHARPVATVDAE